MEGPARPGPGGQGAAGTAQTGPPEGQSGRRRAEIPGQPDGTRSYRREFPAAHSAGPAQAAGTGLR